jgi:hypothetical protein
VRSLQNEKEQCCNLQNLFIFFRIYYFCRISCFFCRTFLYSAELISSAEFWFFLQNLLIFYRIFYFYRILGFSAELIIILQNTAQLLHLLVTTGTQGWHLRLAAGSRSSRVLAHRRAAHGGAQLTSRHSLGTGRGAAIAKKPWVEQEGSSIKEGESIYRSLLVSIALFLNHIQHSIHHSPPRSSTSRRDCLQIQARSNLECIRGSA